MNSLNLLDLLNGCSHKSKKNLFAIMIQKGYLKLLKQILEKLSNYKHLVKPDIINLFINNFNDLANKNKSNDFEALLNIIKFTILPDAPLKIEL